MSAEEIHVNDIGTVFKILIKDGEDVQDISTASTKNIIFLKPDGTSVTKSGTFTTDGTDGYIQYTTVLDDIDLVGIWKIQAHIIMGTLNFKTDISPFRVYANL
jgi:hypothetical protein